MKFRASPDKKNAAGIPLSEPCPRDTSTARSRRETHVSLRSDGADRSSGNVGYKAARLVEAIDPAGEEIADREVHEVGMLDRRSVRRVRNLQDLCIRYGSGDRA